MKLFVKSREIPPFSISVLKKSELYFMFQLDLMKIIAKYGQLQSTDGPETVGILLKAIKLIYLKLNRGERTS